MPLAASFLIVPGLVAAGAFLAVQLRAAAREAAAEARFPPTGRNLTVNGRKVHAVVMGNGPDIVLLHGAGGNLRDFAFAFAGQLAPRYRVILLDRPGAGFSGRASDAFDQVLTTDAETLRDQADLMKAAAIQLGADRPLVLGHSYGAAVAMAWALHHPSDIAALVVVAGPVMPWEGGLDWFYRVNGSLVGGMLVPPLITAFASQAMIDDGLAGVFAPNAAPEGYADALGVPLSLRRSAIRANARQVTALRAQLVDMAALYPQLRVPVEIVHGSADVTVPLDIHALPLSRLVPDAHLTILPGVGHMPHHAAPGKVIDAIDRAAARVGLRWDDPNPIV